MEHQPTRGGEQERIEALSHDDVPEKGQWLYVVDSEGWDQGQDSGLWLPAFTTTDQAVEALKHRTGRELTGGDLAVVDQIGLDTMADEDQFGGFGEPA